MYRGACVPLCTDTNNFWTNAWFVSLWHCWEVVDVLGGRRRGSNLGHSLVILVTLPFLGSLSRPPRRVSKTLPCVPAMIWCCDANRAEEPGSLAWKPEIRNQSKPAFPADPTGFFAPLVGITQPQYLFWAYLMTWPHLMIWPQYATVCFATWTDKDSEGDTHTPPPANHHPPRRARTFLTVYDCHLWAKRGTCWMRAPWSQPTHGKQLQIQSVRTQLSLA